MVPPVQYGGDEVSAVVLDIGSNSTRAGYAGEDSPKTVFPTSYATVAGEGEAEASYYHGASVNLWRPNGIISNPISDGLITDWAAIERTLDHAFRDRMRLSSLEDHPLLVTEPSWNTSQNREKMCELAFEKWNAPAYYAVDRSVMSSFAAGKGSALVLDIGDELASVVPIYDGFVLRKAIQKQPAAGRLLSQLVLHQLKQHEKPAEIVPQYLVKSKEAVEPDAAARAVLRDDRFPKPDSTTTSSYHSAQELRVLHEFKESVLEVNPGPWDDALVGGKATRPFEFPNGYNSYYGTMRSSVPEVLFNPARWLPKEFADLPLPTSPSTIPSHPYNALQPIDRLVANSLVQIDPDLHATLLSNVVVTGGSTLIPGFLERLNAELTTLAGGVKLKIHAASSPAERLHSSWLGGSVIASLGTFHQLWIGKAEYEEIGSSVVHRRTK